MRRYVLALAALLTLGCHILERIPCVGMACAPDPQPTVEPSLPPPPPDPSPTAGPDPVPSPSPTAGPDPVPSPSPTAGPDPVPSPTAPPPSPLPPEERWCSFEPGARNWPLMPGSDKQRSEGGVCPSCWSKNPEQIVEWCGLVHVATRPRNDGAGRRYVFDVTCHSTAPRCPHRPDQRTCEVLWGCQPPEPAMYQTGPGFDLARVDRQSDNPYRGQIHISDPAENGTYTIWACPPGVRPDGSEELRCRSWVGYVGTDGDIK